MVEWSKEEQKSFRELSLEKVGNEELGEESGERREERGERKEERVEEVVIISRPQPLRSGRYPHLGT